MKKKQKKVPLVDMDKMKQLFLDIKASFSNLKMELETKPEHVDLNMEISKQNGLKFNVCVNLQGDELHLNVGEHFWLEWFPCTDQKVADAYVEAVKGILSGRLRILETYRGKKIVKSELQFPEKNMWVIKGTYAHGFNLPLIGRKTTKSLINGEDLIHKF